MQAFHWSAWSLFCTAGLIHSISETTPVSITLARWPFFFTGCKLILKASVVSLQNNNFLLSKTLQTWWMVFTSQASVHWCEWKAVIVWRGGGRLNTLTHSSSDVKWTWAESLWLRQAEFWPIKGLSPSQRKVGIQLWKYRQVSKTCPLT